MSPPLPRLGDVVLFGAGHSHDDGFTVVPAVVTQIVDDGCMLAVFSPSGSSLIPLPSVPVGHATEPTRGKYWPR